MGLFLGAVVIVTISMLGVALFALWLINKSAGAAFTHRFQDAEFILEHHQAPPAWTKRKGGFVWLMQDGGKLDPRKRLASRNQPAGDRAEEKARVLNRLDELIQFFETCPFFEDEETRELLLEELGQERSAWETRGLTEIAGADEHEM